MLFRGILLDLNIFPDFPVVFLSLIPSLMARGLTADIVGVLVIEIFKCVLWPQLGSF